MVHERLGVFWFFRLGFLEEGFLPVSYCVESLLVCSNNGGDTYTDRQTGRFHRYIVEGHILSSRLELIFLSSQKMAETQIQIDRLTGFTVI